MITIKDVAREARVSVASVSRALNGSASVTEPMRHRILGVASRLRYVPHGAARSLITKRTHTVGALLPDLYGEFFSELIRGIDVTARAHGLHLLVSSSHGNPQEAAAALRAMQGRVDGLLMMSPYVDATFVHNHVPDAIPAVLMNSAVKGGRFATLNIDNFGGAYAMTGHLIAAGHNDIAIITGPAGNFDACERLRGFRKAIRDSRKRIEIRVLAGEFTEESGRVAGARLLTAASRPTAVFAANDMMAIGCLQALADHGLRVPADIAVAGFDDIPVARLLSPPLTTVRVDIAGFGRYALEQLAERIDHLGAAPPAGQQPRCEIIVRESCGSDQRADHTETRLNRHNALVA